MNMDEYRWIWMNMDEFEWILKNVDQDIMEIIYNWL